MVDKFYIFRLQKVSAVKVPVFSNELHFKNLHLLLVNGLLALILKQSAIKNLKLKRHAFYGFVTSIVAVPPKNCRSRLYIPSAKHGGIINFPLLTALILYVYSVKSGVAVA